MNDFFPRSRRANGRARPEKRFARACRVAALAVLLAFAAGCENHLWWEYRDDPYIADMAEGGEEAALVNVANYSPEKRQIALRILSDRAGRAWRNGDTANASRLEQIVIRRYQAEREQKVREYVVAVCAPEIGGRGGMADFLRQRIATGEFPGPAALSLAYLRPRGAVNDIAPLTRHPAPEVRYQAALALAVLADPAGFEPSQRVWREMEAEYWPADLDGLSTPAARNELAAMARRYFGRDFH